MPLLGSFCLKQDSAYKVAYRVFPRDLFPIFRGQDCHMLPKLPNHTNNSIGRKRVSKSLLHKDIQLKSRYCWQAKIDLLVFSIDRCFEVEKFPLELRAVLR